jgi:choline dehydrogenase
VKLFRSAVDWDYMTEPQKELNGRQIYWPRGKMLGGSSSMNARMWVRGFAADYDEWGELAGDQWSFDQMPPLLRPHRGPAARHISARCPRSSTAAWLAAAKESGYRVEPPNTDVPEGFCQTMVTQRRGARWSCADAYLKPGFFSAPQAHIAHGGHRHAGAVRWDPRRRGRIRARRSAGVMRARREVVLCGGAINSPQLLMLSGIGDREQLAEHGIDFARAGPRRGRARRSSAREANQHCRNRRLRHRATASRPPAADTA